MSYHVSTVFSQLIQLVPREAFDHFTGQHQSDRYAKKMTTWQQFLVLFFSQATNKNSLRDIETGLSVHENLWYHLGLETVSRSTLSEGMERRSFAIFEQVFYDLLGKIGKMSAGPPKFLEDLGFHGQLYSLDATVIDLCLAIFPWATFRKKKGALKMHVLLNNTSMIPEHISITNGSVHEITEAKRNTETKECFGLVPGSILTFDRGFTDYGWFSTLDTKGILFVGRLKKNASIWVQTEVQTGNEIGVISDSTITLWDKKKTQEMTMRRVIYIAQDEQDKTKTVRYEFITNNTDLPAQTIADIYKRRWDIELFFKWIKQHLKIKSFLGTSKNAVMAQIWIAMIYYLVLAYIADTNKLTRHSLLSLQRRLDALFFERIHLFHVIHFRRKGTAEELRKILEPPNQMILF